MALIGYSICPKNCLCGKCESKKEYCCSDHEKVNCPGDTERFDPEYICPDFTPREEEPNNATN